MEHIFDIAVIGAGPAGSSAAKSAALLGAKVCLLERNNTPGFPVRCGEGIGMKSLIEFSEARPEWIKCEITRSAMISPNGTKVTISDIDKSAILDRERMDGDLAKEAVKVGAQLFINTPITSVIRNAAGIYVCKSDAASFTAKIIIIADGVESRIARQLGWNTCLSNDDVQSCAFTRLYSPLIEPNTCVFYIGSKISPGGYVWVFARGSGEANIGLGVLGRHCNAGKPKELLLNFINKEFPGCRIGPIHCGGVPVGKTIHPLVKHGAMLVGDAARQVNCISGAGIAYSLFAGTIAGKTAAEALQNAAINYNHLKNYEKQWKKRLKKQQLRSYALKEFVIHHANDAFLDNIAQSIVKKKSNKTRYLTVFLTTFSRHPLLLFKAFKLFK
jgi:digeranylgeranylglycerophospholipid reductase